MTRPPSDLTVRMVTMTPTIRRIYRLALLTVIIVAVTLAVVGCTPATYTGPAGAPKVAIVGDSITAGARDELELELGQYRRSIAAVPGITLEAGRTELLNPLLATRPDVVVIELGVNSALDGWPAGDDLRSLERTLTALDAVPCVVWLTPTALAPSYYDHVAAGTLRSRIAAFTASLDKRLPAHPRQHRARFGDLEDARPELLDPDRLHLTPAGSAELAAYVEAAIADACPKVAR